MIDDVPKPGIDSYFVEFFISFYFTAGKKKLLLKWTADQRALPSSAVYNLKIASESNIVQFTYPEQSFEIDEADEKDTVMKISNLCSVQELRPEVSDVSAVTTRIH